MTPIWLYNFEATMTHATVAVSRDGESCPALCGACVWKNAQTYKAERRILSGPIPKCGHCKRILAGKKGGK